MRAGFALSLAPPKDHSARARAFFLFQQQAPGDVGQLQSLEDRPDVEQRVDGLGARVEWFTVRIADALPAEHRPPRQRLGEGDRALLIGSLLGHGLDGRIVARRHLQRGGQWAQLHPETGGALALDGIEAEVPGERGDRGARALERGDEAALDRAPEPGYVDALLGHAGAAAEVAHQRCERDRADAPATASRRA